MTIWDNERLWPKASSQYVFLGRAFQDVGAALFLDEWTGLEALTPPTPLADAQAKLVNTLRAQLLPPPAARIRDGGKPVAKARLPEISEDQRAAWAEEFERKRADETAAKDASLSRRAVVAECIASRARDGALDTFGLWAGGGVDLVPLPPSIWNVRADWTLFQACQANHSPPRATSAVPYFLFLTQASLDRALSRGKGEVADQGAGGVQSTVRAIGECTEWLRREFEKPETADVKRDEFKTVAIGVEFKGRLSGRGFRTAWAEAVKKYPSRRASGPKPRP